MTASAAVASHSLHGDGRGGDNRRPEESVLCGVVQAELETFLARAQARERPVPRFVEREFRGFLRCGILAAIQPPDVTEAILDCLDLPSRAPPTPAAFPDPDGADGWPGDFEATLSARAARAARWTRDDGQGRSDVGCGALRTAPRAPETARHDIHTATSCQNAACLPILASLMFHNGSEISGRDPALEGSARLARTMKFENLSEVRAKKKAPVSVVPPIHGPC